MIINQKTKQIIVTAFANGSTHDFRLFKESKTGMACQVLCLADPGYQGLVNLHANSRKPKKKSKHHLLAVEQDVTNRELAHQCIFVEHVMRKVKIFHILSERYRNQRKPFGLCLNLIASLSIWNSNDFCKRSNVLRVSLQKLALFLCAGRKPA